jgi:hypothetical protein
MKGQYMKRVITGMLIFLFIFSQEVIFIMWKTGSEPSTLIASIFGFCGVEGGLMAWIKKLKIKRSKEGELNDD